MWWLWWLGRWICLRSYSNWDISGGKINLPQTRDQVEETPKLDKIGCWWNWASLVQLWCWLPLWPAIWRKYIMATSSTCTTTISTSATTKSTVSLLRWPSSTPTTVWKTYWVSRKGMGRPSSTPIVRYSSGLPYCCWGWGGPSQQGDCGYGSGRGGYSGGAGAGDDHVVVSSYGGKPM